MLMLVFTLVYKLKVIRAVLSDVDVVGFDLESVFIVAGKTQVVEVQMLNTSCQVSVATSVVPLVPLHELLKEAIINQVYLLVLLRSFDEKVRIVIGLKLFFIGVELVLVYIVGLGIYVGLLFDIFKTLKSF